MLDHVSLYVKDFQVSKTFYEKALLPIGYRCLMEFEGRVGGFGETQADLWVIQNEEVRSQHLAFVASDRLKVDAFYQAALMAGGQDHGAPGLRPEYAPDYYAAFILDPDGHNIEVVCRKSAE